MRFALTLCLVLAACQAPKRYTPPTVPLPTRAAIDAADIGEAPTLEEARPLIEAAVREQLKDPESARFKWPDTGFRRTVYGDGYRGWTIAWELRLLCNAKNSYGGYAGHTPYSAYFINGGLMFVQSDEDDDSGRISRRIDGARVY